MADAITQAWIRGPADEAAVKEGCYFDVEAAERVRVFMRTFCRHSKGKWAGQPLELLDWQWQDVIAPLFGWQRPDGFRRYRKAYIEIPKKNGKSTLASAIGLYLLVADGEQGAEVYSVANDKEQAGIVHGEAIRMVKASASLRKYLSIHETTKNISFERTNSWYRALSSEANTKEGYNAHGLIVDELHSWRGRELWDALRFAMVAREQPLLFVITTAGDDPLSVCRDQHDYAQAVLRGTHIDTQFFGYLRAARQRSEGDEVDDDWSAKETWYRANPSLGVTMKEEDFARDQAEAAKKSSDEASFKRYRLSIWATSVNPWLRSADWQKCQRKYAAEALRGCRAFGGLDLASTRDLCAFVLTFPWDLDLFRLLPFFWLPEETVESPDAPEQYRLWRRAGLLRVTPGNVVDYAHVKRDIGELSGMYRILEFAFDPWNAEKITQEIEEEYGVKRFAFGQTIDNFAPACKEFERLVISGKLHHDGNPILTWQAGHVQVKSNPNNNLRPVKPPHGSQKKIDGIVAAIMSLARAMLSTEGPSMYETQGITYV